MARQVDHELAEAVRHAAAEAALAPSVHNTQPWRFALGPSTLEIHRDLTRQLRVLDPLGRQLTISVGCALFNARVALADIGYVATVHRFPDTAVPDLVARIDVSEERTAWAPLSTLSAAIHDRRTNRRQFAPDPVPAAVVATLIEAAADEGVRLLPITRLDHRIAVATLSKRADELENADPAYRAELRRWTTDDPRSPDGVPAMAVPHVDAGSGDDLPLRDYDTHGMGWLPVETRSAMSQCLLLLGTDGNSAADWCRAGEALERVLLEVTRLGYAASPLTQMIEVAQTNQTLCDELDLTMHPHLLLRVGRAPETPRVNRRALTDLIVAPEG